MQREVQPVGITRLGNPYYAVKGRTARKLHAMRAGSSVAACGWWTRGHVRRYDAEVTCQRCLEAIRRYHDG